MSGIVNDEVRERAARVQSADVLSKPFAADDLLRKLEGLLAAPRPAPVSPAVVAAPPLVNGNGHAHVHPAPEPAPVEPMPVAAAPAAPAAPPPPPVVEPPAPVVEPQAPAVTAPKSAEAVPKSMEATPASPRVPGADSAASVTTSILAQFVAIEGVQWAVLADREGFLLEAAPASMSDPEVAGALSSCLAESSEGLGRELGRGALHGMMLEYERGMVVIYGVGAGALLAIALTEPSVLGKVRYYAKKSLPELMQAV
jgi:predicted regulator of Ras-like GTPase activity (Roadblock/LC7/MglB family)